MAEGSRDSRSGTRDGIVVLGCPRSGTTLLRRLLDAHPNITAPGETHLLTACARFLFGEPSAGGIEVGVLTGLGYTGFSEDEITRRLREFAFAFRREHAARQGTGRWLEKTAVDGFNVTGIERLCGDDVQFVCITRHGLDVTLSMREWAEKAEVYFADVHRYVARYPRALEAFAHAWVDSTTAILAFVERHADNALLLRYEDLASDAPAELRRILEFLGEEWDEGLIERALRGDADPKGFSDWKTFSKTTINTASVGRWHALSPWTTRELAKIVNPTLLACRYEAVPATPFDSDDAQRRYELGLMLQRMRAKSDEDG